jgi:hypothetical protein
MQLHITNSDATHLDFVFIKEGEFTLEKNSYDNKERPPMSYIWPSFERKENVIMIN